MAFVSPASPKLRVENLVVRYHGKPAVHGVSIDIRPYDVLALIGPSGCGKSSFLRALNRMIETIEGASVEGRVLLEGEDIYGPDADVVVVRQRIGMVFQRSNPFAQSIFENVAYGLRIQGIRDKQTIAERVERSLRQAALWDEVKDRLHASGLELSGGQQQRLCIARALAVEPAVRLVDEAASALDPVATATVGEVVQELRSSLSVVIVTHNMRQAARVSQRTAFFHMGRLVEVDDTRTIFSSPRVKETEDYVSGRFG